MIHHETITAKLAPNNGEGDSGTFDVIEPKPGDFQVFQGGLNVCYRSTLESAVEAAQKAAGDFDQRALEELKQQWDRDPSWDLETTEGYEDFRQELYIYRLETERDLARKELQQVRAVLASFAALLPGSSTESR
jgi:hypothetical protein